VQATLETYQTQLTEPEDDPDLPVTKWKISGRYVSGLSLKLGSFLIEN
jgi:hypothetical protein